MVQENSIFVIDKLSLKNSDDWLMTDLGLFDNRGNSGKIFKICDNVVVSSRKMPRQSKDRRPLGEDEYLVRTVFWRHHKYTNFCRLSTEITVKGGRPYHGSNSNGIDLSYGLIQYYFKAEEHHVRPHKKPKGKSFLSTAPSFRKTLARRAMDRKGPTSIYDEVMSEMGDTDDCEAVEDLPRDLKQVQNARFRVKKKEKDCEFMEVLDISASQTYLKDLQWKPNPQVIVCPDGLLDETVDKCCAAGTKNIFSIDTTYNVGEFYVMCTSYQSAKLYDVNTSKQANLPGPALFHVEKDYQVKSFMKFSHTLIEEKPEFE